MVIPNYLKAVGAFPEAASPTSITSNYPVSFSIQALPPPPVSLNVSVNAPPSKKETKPSVPCLYTPLNFISSYLAQQYGLVYPPRHVVSAFLRNGVSPGCRSYQLKFLVNHDENGNIIYYKNGRVSFKDNWLFERWLFWKVKSVDCWINAIGMQGSPVHCGRRSLY